VLHLIWGYIAFHVLLLRRQNCQLLYRGLFEPIDVGKSLGLAKTQFHPSVLLVFLGLLLIFLRLLVSGNLVFYSFSQLKASANNFEVDNFFNISRMVPGTVTFGMGPGQSGYFSYL